MLSTTPHSPVSSRHSSPVSSEPETQGIKGLPHPLDVSLASSGEEGEGKNMIQDASPHFLLVYEVRIGGARWRSSEGVQG